MPAFLLEIGLEEIPASMIAAAQAELAERVRKLLTRERLATGDLDVRSYSTPRRLTVLVEGLLPKQADMEEQVIGPSVAVAYKNGAPTPAATAFAKKSGVEIAALRTIQNAKGEYVAATVHHAGRGAAEVLASAVPAEIGGIYWPKNMYWRAGKPERFVRPVRWLLALLDEEILPIEFAGVTADGVSYGHRVLHGDDPVVVRRPVEYAEKLAAAYVQVDPEARRHRIRKALDVATRQISGARWREDEELVDVVTNLTEWPTVLLGSFEREYLTLPEEILVTVMRDHQKYFALEDAKGKLLPNFLAVLNIEVDAAGADIIRHGNERVLRARFNDARFFWDVDQKIPLVDRVEMLKHVTFHKDLGSYWDKTQANILVAKDLANVVLNSGILVDIESLETAVRLAKTDLTTELVKEFTELQGTVGGLYASAQGICPTVAQAMYWQYRPASAEDAIPPTTEGQILGVADRMHTIAAMFRMQMLPTGSGDPFGLRRAGNGIVKILTESGLPITLQKLVDVVYAPKNPQQTVLVRSLSKFLTDRVEFYLEKVRGFDVSVIRNVLIAADSDKRDLADITKIVQDVNEMRTSPEFEAISSAFKRIKNIFSQAMRTDGIHDTLEQSGLVEPAEIYLYHQAKMLSVEYETLCARRSYREALGVLAALRPAIDAFFDQVMVMVADDGIRHNRIALLQYIFSKFSRIADFSGLGSTQQPS